MGKFKVEINTMALSIYLLDNPTIWVTFAYDCEVGVAIDHSSFLDGEVNEPLKEEMYKIGYALYPLYEKQFEQYFTLHFIGYSIPGEEPEFDSAGFTIQDR